VNEKSKRLMSEQKSSIFNKLKTEFGLEVFEDEIAEDEEERLLKSTSYNCFIMTTSDFGPTESGRTISQDITIEYYSENRDDVDEQIIDIISIVSSVKAVTFRNTRKQRLQIKDTDRYIDLVILTFKRMIPIECQV
jgi:hypothetical protein